MRTAEILLASLLMSLAAPALAQTSSDLDGDGVVDREDNCFLAPNPYQTDADGDYCGNVCDADFTNDGIVGVADFAFFATQCFGKTEAPGICCLIERGPYPECAAGVDVFGAFAALFNTVPGPSFTTPGTVACP